MRGLGFIADPFYRVQSQRCQFRARGRVIRVKDAANPQTLRDLDEHPSVFDIDDPLGWSLGDVQRQPKKMSTSGLRRWPKQEEIKKSTNAPSLNFRIDGIQFAGLVADHGNLQAVPDLELSD